MLRYVFFINPAAGKGIVQKEITAAIDRYFRLNGGDYKTIVTRFRGDAEQTARNEAQTGDEIFMYACGGEGTSYELINGVFGFDNVSVGVFPCGSANDFLKFFGDIKPFLDLESQLNGTPVPLDLIRAGDRYCMNGCSVGMDAMVARDMNAFKRWPFVSGRFAYKLSIVRNFLRRLGVTINLTVDSKKIGKVRCLFAVIANAPYYGGGYMGAPDAVPNDGTLNFTLVNVISKLKIPKFLSLYEKGRHGSLEYCRLQSCTEAEFSADNPVPVNLDGEIIMTAEMRFSIVPQGIKFIIPMGISGEKLLLSNKILTNV